MTVSKAQLAEELLTYAETFLSLDASDKVWLRNRLLAALGADAGEAALDCEAVKTLELPDSLTEKVKALALEEGLCEEGYEEIFATELMGLMTPPPSAVCRLFEEKKASEGLSSAVAWFYDLCIKNNYIQLTAIRRNIEWDYDDHGVPLEVTVNLSKPEKSNKDIAKLLSLPKASGYPACQLCEENVGYRGTLRHPARANLRTLPLTLAGEEWFLQYSPYAYYREHCIAINRAHTPMKVDRTTPEKLLDFVDAFPMYFMGSNAALPIVGGSILNHEHFQGGGHLMPLQRAGVLSERAAKGEPSVTLCVTNWYNSAIRLLSRDRAALSRVAGNIIDGWREYSDPSVGILAKTNDTPHNTLSPIARKDGEVYIMDLILRNNRTDETYPDGIFHAHPEHHNIKSEGIGLIEAMGRFILPGRLKRQLSEIADLLSGAVPYDPAAIAEEGHSLYLHREMIARMMKEKKGTLTKEEADTLLRDHVNKTCAAILGNTAVFKKDAAGEAAFAAFLSQF